MAEPKTSTLPADQICVLLQLTPPELARLSKSGFLPKPSGGAYPVLDTTRAYIQFVRDFATVADLAGLLDLTDRSIQLYAKEGRFPKAERGFYKVRDCVREYIRTLRAVAEGSGDISYTEAKKLVTLQKLERERFAHAQEKGLVVEKSAVKEAAFQSARTVRNAMQNIPSRVAPIVAAMDDQFKVYEFLKKEVADALNNLAEGKEEEEEDLEPRRRKDAEEKGKKKKDMARSKAKG